MGVRQGNKIPHALAVIGLVLLIGTLIKTTGDVPSALKTPFTYSLRARLARSEQLYQDMIVQRHEMLKAYPNPLNKDMFPARDEEGYWKTPFTIWDFLPAAGNCPWEMERVGRLGDGGKWVCGMSKYEALPARKPCVVYSFGIQFESSFEEAFLKRTHCEIWGYDYSVSNFGKQLNNSDYEARAHFTQAGIGGATNLKKSPPFYSIQDLMALNRHQHIDVLKIDIEGAEFESMRSLLKFFRGIGELPVGQFMVEIHLEQDGPTMDEFLQWWEHLEDAGFRAVWTEPNLLVTTLPFWDGLPRFAEYTMINIKDSQNALLR